MKPLPVCEFGIRKPHNTRDCSKVDGKKCRDLVEHDNCPKDHIKLRTKDVKRPKTKVVIDPDGSKETVKTEAVSALEELFGKDEPDNDPGVETLFNGEEYTLPNSTTLKEIISNPPRSPTVKKKCDLCGHVDDFAYAAKKCPHCGKKSLRLLEPKTISTKRKMITDAEIDAKIIEIGMSNAPPSIIVDPKLMPCGHYAKEHELRIDNDMEIPGMVYYRNVCMNGHKSEWMFIGKIPDPSNCPIDEEY